MFRQIHVQNLSLNILFLVTEDTVSFKKYSGVESSEEDDKISINDKVVKQNFNSNIESTHRT